MNSLFSYRPHDQEAEKASNGYLMSLIALMAGMPLPIINLIATVIFYLANRRGSYFVRWHCTQTLVSQFTLLLFNSIGFSWTMAILFSHTFISNSYIAYIITVILFNLVEFIFTIIAAIKTRKGIHVEWWFSGEVAHLICKQ
ncbi:MAG: DUF4870 domain-containing protein [Taibaiella sp.]|nr:DUF4870 domain-containing protein [Taibaiella sp.]